MCSISAPPAGLSLICKYSSSLQCHVEEDIVKIVETVNMGERSVPHVSATSPRRSLARTILFPDELLHMCVAITFVLTFEHGEQGHLQHMIPFLSPHP